jgi:dTMP kinase
MARGPFISLDGLDGAGKSTQCRLLSQWLRRRGFVVTQCADPGGTEIGQVLRGLLLDHRRDINLQCEALLFMASRAQLVAEIIRPALEASQAVVSDRFLLANIAYQGYGGGLDPTVLHDLGLLATGGLEPDLTFVLDLPLTAARGRRKAEADRMERRDEAFHDRVRDGFLAEAGKRPDRIRVLDAGQPLEQVQEIIRSEVASFLKGPNVLGTLAGS